MTSQRLLPVPLRLQNNDGECLAACSSMVLHYLGLTVDYRKLLRLLNIKDFGAPFYHLQQLEALGVTVTLRQGGTFDDLAEQLQQNHPCIVSVETSELPYWEGESVYHALVVIGMDAEYVYLNDPAFTNSPLRVTQGDFALAWLERGEVYAIITKR